MWVRKFGRNTNSSHNACTIEIAAVAILGADIEISLSGASASLTRSLCLKLQTRWHSVGKVENEKIAKADTKNDNAKWFQHASVHSVFFQVGFFSKRMVRESYCRITAVR